MWDSATETSIGTLWPCSDVQYPTSMSMSLSLPLFPPLPHVPIRDPSSVMWLAGWTRPYSRLCRTEATLTALQGPVLSCWRLRYGRGCSISRRFAQSPTHLLTHSFSRSLTHSLIRVQVARGLMQGAYHIRQRSRRVWPVWAGKPRPPFTRAMPCHTQGDTTTGSHTTAIPHNEKGLVSSRSAVDPCPCDAMPLLFSRLVLHFPAHISQ